MLTPWPCKLLSWSFVGSYRNNCAGMITPRTLLHRQLELFIYHFCIYLLNVNNFNAVNVKFVSTVIISKLVAMQKRLLFINLNWSPKIFWNCYQKFCGSVLSVNYSFSYMAMQGEIYALIWRLNVRLGKPYLNLTATSALTTLWTGSNVVLRKVEQLLHPRDCSGVMMSYPSCALYANQYRKLYVHTHRAVTCVYFPSIRESSAKTMSW